MTDAELSEQIDIFYGGANVNSATVYVRLSEGASAAGLSLAGFIRGPHCLHSTMLPATIRLVDAGPGPSVLAKALVPDPCYWTPELPALYDVHVELRQGDKILATAVRTLGMRQFGPRGRFFYLGGKRWTVRAAYSRLESPLDLLEWHDTPLSLCATNPSDAICDEASRVGVLVVALLDHSHELVTELRRLVRHAAVGIVVLDVGEPAHPLPVGLSPLAPNVVLARHRQAQHVADDDAWDLIGAAAVVNVVTDPASFAHATEQLTLPILAQREFADEVDSATARQRCDQLQADLAPYDDLAGYIV